MAVQAIPAIIALVATAASITAQAVMAKKAREAQLGVKGTSGGEQAMLGIQKMKAADMAQMGGLSPGRYQREMMDQDISAMQTQALVTKMGENPFADAFKKEAFARVALSELRSSMQKRQMQISDLDAETLAKNTFEAHEMSKDAAIAESRILDRKNQIKLMELEKKQQTYQTMARLIGSGAKAAGQLAQHASERGVFDSWGKSKPGEGTGGFGQEPIGFQEPSQLGKPSLLAEPTGESARMSLFGDVQRKQVVWDEEDLYLKYADYMGGM
jgi:hypothetical protein